MKKWDRAQMPRYFALILVLLLLGTGTSCHLLDNSPKPIPYLPSSAHQPIPSSQVSAFEMSTSSVPMQAETYVGAESSQIEEIKQNSSQAEQNLLKMLSEMQMQRKKVDGIYYTGGTSLLILTDGTGTLLDYASAKEIKTITLPDSAVDIRIKHTNNGFAIFYMQMRADLSEDPAMQISDGMAPFPAVICSLFDKNGNILGSLNFNQIAQANFLPVPPLYPMHVDISMDAEQFVLTNMDDICLYSYRDNALTQIASIQNAEPTEVGGLLGFSQIAFTSDEQSIAFLGSQPDTNGQTGNANGSYSAIGLIPLDGTGSTIHPLPNFAISSFSVSPGHILFNLDVASISLGATKSETSILLMKEEDGEIMQFSATANPLSESTHVFSSVCGHYYATLEPLENNILKTIRIYSSEDGSLIHDFTFDGNQQGRYHYTESLVILDDLHICIFTCPISSKDENEILYFKF